MKVKLRKAAGAAIVLLSVLGEASIRRNHHLELLQRKHQHLHKLHSSSAREDGIPLPELKKRGECAFPTNAGLVAVTPDQQNAGWAISPDRLCEPGNYCPYACPSGQLAMQWNPEATSYSYPLSMVRPVVHLKLSFADYSRMVVFTAMRMARSRSRFQKRTTVSMEKELSARKTPVESQWLSARPFFPGTRPCSSPPLLIVRKSWLYLEWTIGATRQHSA